MSSILQDWELHPNENMICFHRVKTYVFAFLYFLKVKGSASSRS